MCISAESRTLSAMRNDDGTIRKLRQTSNEPGQAHELTFSCFHGWPRLSRDRTRNWILTALDQARNRSNFDLWAYVIMPEHAHVLLLPQDEQYAMSNIVRAIKQPVAQKAVHFLREHAPEWLCHLRVARPNGRIEYRFWQQGGGYDRNIRKAATAWASVAYLHANPVRRGLVAEPEDWPWSSARWYAGLEDVRLAPDACPPDPPRT